jgi:hypothetical protein
MRVKTSRTGFVREGAPNAGSGEVAHALLYDFDIDDHNLKDYHFRWLSNSAINVINKDPAREWVLYVKGKTSRTGTDQHDLLLSQQRAQAVTGYLGAALGARRPKIVHWGVGKTEATGPKAEDAGDRAVEVVIRDETPLPPPIKKKEPRPLPDAVCTRSYVMSETAALNVTVGLLGGIVGPSGDGMVFKLEEPGTGQVAYYAYIGVGVGAGTPLDKIKKIQTLVKASRVLRSLKSILNGAVSVPGPPNPFTYTGPCTTTVSDFSGLAGFASMSLALGTSISSNEFGFGGLRGWREFFAFRVELKSFNTANTIGLPSVTNTRGYMFLVEDD